MNAFGGGGDAENFLLPGGPIAVGVGLLDQYVLPTDEEEACKQVGGIWTGDACIEKAKTGTGGVYEQKAFCDENPDDPRCGGEEEEPPGDDEEEEKKKPKQTEDKKGPVGPVGPVKPDKKNKIEGTETTRTIATIAAAGVGAIAVPVIVSLAAPKFAERHPVGTLLGGAAAGAVALGVVGNVTHRVVFER